MSMVQFLGPRFGFNIIGRGVAAPPSVISATVINANTIRFVFSEAMLVTIAGWSFKLNGSNLPFASVSGAGLIWDFSSDPIAAGDVVLYSFTGAATTKAIATNIPLPAATDQAVLNTILATLGYTSIGGNVYNETSNGMLGQRGTAVFNGVSDSIEAYISAPAGLTAPAKFALYELIGTTLGPLIGVSAEIIMDDVLQWRNIPLPGLNINSGTDYYVCEWSGNDYNMTYDLGVGGPSFESFTFLYPFYPASITSAQRADYGDGFSIYLKYLPN